ncbi:hypothetical protein BDF14DRAFT_1767240, partial [Spinellus fusiger]
MKKSLFPFILFYLRWDIQGANIEFPSMEGIYYDFFVFSFSFFSSPEHAELARFIFLILMITKCTRTRFLLSPFFFSIDSDFYFFSLCSVGYH